MTSTPKLRDALNRLPAYAAGKPPVGSSELTPYKLSSNENPFGPLPGVMEAITKAAGDLNRYPDPMSNALAEALAERHGVTRDHVALGTGSVGVLQQLVQITAGPGDEVLYAWRSFEAYPIMTIIAGATPVQVPLAPGHRHDLAAMLAAITENTRLIMVCTPNNPTGAVVLQSELDEFLDQVPPHILVVIDEAYVEFDRDPSSVRGLETYRARPNVAVLRTFSKAYGLAGMRVGFCIAHSPVAQALRQTQVPFGVSNLAQAAAIASLDAEDALMDRVDHLVDERHRVEAALAEQGWELPPSQANFVWFPLGDRIGEFVDACEAVNLSVRRYADDGVRVTIAETDANDRLLTLTRSFVSASHH